MALANFAMVWPVNRWRLVHCSHCTHMPILQQTRCNTSGICDERKVTLSPLILRSPVHHWNGRDHVRANGATIHVMQLLMVEGPGQLLRSFTLLPCPPLATQSQRFHLAHSSSSLSQCLDGLHPIASVASKRLCGCLACCPCCQGPVG